MKIFVAGILLFLGMNLFASAQEGSAWEARWIAANGATRDAAAHEDFISPAFAKTFVVESGATGATLRVAAPGFCEVWLNGGRVGDRVLDPTPSVFTKTVYYSIYDVTSQLKAGTNTCTVLLGHGWYDVRARDAWNFHSAAWRDRPCVRLRIDWIGKAGTKGAVATDASWRQVASPVGYDDVRECGEVVGAYDPRCPDLAAKTYFAEEVQGPGGVLCPETHPPARVVRTFRPCSIERQGAGWRIRFPESVAGWVRFTARGLPRGRVVSVQYDELPYDWASPEKGRRIDKYFTSIASHPVGGVKGAFQLDRFVCSGRDVETFEPRFTWKGFQSVYVTGLDAAPKMEDVTACFVRTDYRETGSVETSDPRLNALLAAAARSFHANFTDGIPTDCPTREKMGWTGDAAHTVEYGLYLCDVERIYPSWLRTVRDTQRADGAISGIAPSGGWGYQAGYNCPIWNSALAIIPWTIYVYRGDRQPMLDCADALVRLIDHNAGLRRDAEGLIDETIGNYGGDWWPPDWKRMPNGRYATSVYQMAMARIAAEMLKMKGDAQGADRMVKYAEKLRTAVNRRFNRNGVYDLGNQACQAYALAFGVVPKEQLAAARARLVASVEEKGRHYDCGFVGAKHVLRELSRAGRTDLAFAMLVQKTAPTLMQTVDRTPGAGLWDEWTDAASSRCHPMWGDFYAWVCQYPGGVRPVDAPEGAAAALFDGAVPGMKEFMLAPDPVKGLDALNVRVASPQGEIRSAWRREGTKIRYAFTVPKGAVARLRLPGWTAIRRLAEGTHEFFE